MYMLVPMNVVFTEQEFVCSYEAMYCSMIISTGHRYLLADTEILSLEYNKCLKRN